MNSKLIFGVVSGMSKCTNICSCYFRQGTLIVNGNDIVHDLEDKTSTYIVFNEYPDTLDGLEGEHQYGTDTYEKIKNYCTEQHLLSIYTPKDSMNLGTCYSEWTCEYDREVEVIRTEKMRSLFGKYVVFFI